MPFLKLFLRKRNINTLKKNYINRTRVQKKSFGENNKKRKIIITTQQKIIT